MGVGNAPAVGARRRDRGNLESHPSKSGRRECADMTHQVEIDTILTCTSSMALRSDLTAEQRAEAIRIGRIGIASGGSEAQGEGTYRCLRKPDEWPRPAGHYPSGPSPH